LYYRTYYFHTGYDDTVIIVIADKTE